MASAEVLELRRSELMTLAALSDPDVSLDTIDLDDLARLRAVGLVEGTALIPDVVPIAAAVRSPIVRLRLDFLGPERPVACTGWIDGRFTVVAVPRPGGVDDVKITPTAYLPARLAGFTGLGPRPAGEWGWQGDRSRLDALLAESALGGGFVPTEMLRLHWRVTMTWSRGTRSLEVLDSGDGGIWLVCQAGSDAEVSVVPVTTTQVWVALIETLPSTAEVEHASVEPT